MKNIGVLALQGAFQKHGEMIKKLGHQCTFVRYPEELATVDGLIMPGGESTTIGKLLTRFHLFEPIKERIGEGLPVFGTCAGLILLADRIRDSRQHRFGLLDIEVDRNAYGPQIESFETNITVPVLGPPDYRAVFIRAPIITQIEDTVEVLARFEEQAVLIRQGNILGGSFHPELTEDLRIHDYFIQEVN